MRSWNAAGIACFLLMAVPGTGLAQRAAVPGEIASAIHEPRLAAVPAVTAQPTTIAAVRDEPHHRHMRTLWAASIAAMLAGTSADAISSWHQAERNSLLASSDGVFGARGAGIKAGIAAGVLTPQILLRKRKDLRMAFVIADFIEAGVFGGAAIHNFRVGARQP